jgi:hypothetical protein
MAGRTVILEELFSVWIGAKRDHRSDHGKVEIFHSALQVPIGTEGVYQALLRRGMAMRALN